MGAEEAAVGRQLNIQERARVAQQLYHDNRHGDECVHEDRDERTFNRTRTKGGYERQCANCDHAIPCHAYECSECRESFCKVNTQHTVTNKHTITKLIALRSATSTGSKSERGVPDIRKHREHAAGEHL